jgi:ABC-type sugar transport system substrate-binding protein
MKRTSIILSLLVMLAMLATACAPAAAPAASAAPAAPAAPAAAAKHTLVFIPGQLSNPSQAFTWKMIQKHGAELGYEVSVLDGKGDVQEQTKAINNAVAQKVDVILVNPNDAKAIIPATKAAMAAGVIVGVNMAKMADGAEDSVNFFTAVDDIEGGKTAAKAIMAKFPNGATGIEIGGQAGHDAAIRRHDGFTAGIKGTNITVLDYKNPQQWDTAQAQAIAEDMITKYGNKIQFVFCHWDNGATGVINALKAAKMTDVMIIGVDGNKTAFDQVNTWSNYTSIAQNAETIAVSSMKTANLFLAKDAAAKHDNVIPFDIINKDTIKNFTPPEW